MDKVDPSVEDLYWMRDKVISRRDMARADLKACRWWQFARAWRLREDIAGREMQLADLDARIAAKTGEV